MAEARNWKGALAALALGMFLLSLTVGVGFFGTYRGSPAFAWLIRIFFILIVGGIGISCVAWSARELLGRPDDGDAIPTLLLDLCPACGRPAAADALWCATCNLSLSARSTHWTTDAHGKLGGLIGIAFGGGIACLGVGIAIGPYLDGEHRIWANLAFVALGLLLIGVGLALLVGSIAVAWQDLRGVKTWTYGWQTEDAQQSVTVKSTATTVRGRLISAKGDVSIQSLPLRSDASRGESRPGQRPFARMLALLYARSLIALWQDITWTWSTAADKERAHSESSRLMCRLFSERTPTNDVRRPFEVLLRAHPTANLAVAVQDLWKDAAQSELAFRQCLAQPGFEALIADPGFQSLEALIVDQLQNDAVSMRSPGSPEAPSLPS